MEIDEILSDTDTSIYDDEEINEHNWRYEFQEIFNHCHEKKFDDGARPIPSNVPQQIRIPSITESLFHFPLSPVICSRLICEHGKPLSLSNKYDFCGTKLLNSAWQISGDLFEMPRQFTSTVRSMVFDQLSINGHFDVQLKKLLIFGRCPQAKIYHFDDKFFHYLATIVVFLPSTSIGGTYRFTDDNNDENDQDAHRHIFNANQSDPSKAFLLVLPADCQHEIEPIEKGFQLLLIYHLVSKTSSIDEFYSLVAREKCFSNQIERLECLLTYWKNHFVSMPMKLVIPLQHPWDYSPYYSLIFRQKYREILQIFSQSIERHSSSFLLYSAVIQHEKCSTKTNESRLFLHHLKSLSNNSILRFPLEHERTVLLGEFLGDLHFYIDSFEHPITTINRSNSEYRVLIVLPRCYQWDLLLDDHLFAVHHLSYLLSLPSHWKFPMEFSLNFFQTILRDRVTTISTFSPWIDCLIRFHQHSPDKSLQIIKDFLQLKQLKEQFFTEPNLSENFHRFISSTISNEFYHFFRQLLNLSMPMKINEICRFLLDFPSISFRALLINTFIRFIFKPRALPRHIHLSTLCSLLHLLILDGNYSIDVQMTLADQILRRVRNFPTENEVLDKGLKMHLIPLLIHIYRDLSKANRIHLNISPAFVLIYQFTVNTLNYYCSSSQSSSIFNTIPINEALLICPCPSCARIQLFLLDSKSSTLILDFSSSNLNQHCLRQTLNQYPMLSLEYKHQPFTGEQQTLVISKSAYEQEQKQLCFHLRRLLMQLHRI